MARIATLTVVLVLAAHGAAGQPRADEAAAMRDFFAGTLEIDVPAGDSSAKRYFAPDHTYRETGGDGEVKGVWTVEGDRVCTTSGKPPAGERAARYCNLGLGKHIGEAWRDEDPVTGNTVLFKLTAGR